MWDDFKYFARWSFYAIAFMTCLFAFLFGVLGCGK